MMNFKTTTMKNLIKKNIEAAVMIFAFIILIAMLSACSTTRKTGDSHHDYDGNWTKAKYRYNNSLCMWQNTKDSTDVHVGYAPNKVY